MCVYACLFVNGVYTLIHTPLCSSQILFGFESERLNRIQEYERQLAVQRLQEDDERTTALADFKDRMLEERKAFKRQVKIYSMARLSFENEKIKHGQVKKNQYSQKSRFLKVRIEIKIKIMLQKMYAAAP
jgi:hypothetical protein